MCVNRLAGVCAPLSPANHGWHNNNTHHHISDTRGIHKIVIYILPPYRARARAPVCVCACLHEHHTEIVSATHTAIERHNRTMVELGLLLIYFIMRIARNGCVCSRTFYVQIHIVEICWRNVSFFLGYCVTRFVRWGPPVCP